MAKEFYTSPKTDKEGCLCKNGKYSKRCCKGKLINQGVGKLKGGSESALESGIKTRIITRNI